MTRGMLGAIAIVAGVLGLPGVASGVMTITIIVLSAALIPAAWNFRKSYKKVSDMLDKVYGDINPLMRHASAIADNVDYISTAIRVDVQQVSQTVAAVNQRMQQAVAAAEDRINQLNALLEVVQEEAESAFVTTASTIRCRSARWTIRRSPARSMRLRTSTSFRRAGTTRWPR